MNKTEFLSQFNDEDEEKNETLLGTYDFKQLINDEDYEYNFEEHGDIENFLNYKFLGKYDCDKIFGNMFGLEYTDTMNSFWTLFKQYIKISMSDEFELENGEIKKEFIDTYKKQYNFELTNQQLWIVHILNLSKQKNIIFNEKLECFAHFTHTIGNFIEVPASFNTNRYTNTLDYFDLALLCIYKWYETSSDFWLEILLNNDKQAIQNTKEWLLSYNLETSENYTMWENFVGLNGLVGFVDDNLQPIELFQNHFNNFEKLIMDKQKLSNYYEKAKLLNPQNMTDLVECVENINRAIMVRCSHQAEYELYKFDNEDTDDTRTEFDKLIVTNKTDVDFPINADIINYDTFYKIASDSLTVDELFFDIDLLDKGLYDVITDSVDNVSFFRLTPTYVTKKILDWKI